MQPTARAVIYDRVSEADPGRGDPCSRYRRRFEPTQNPPPPSNIVSPR